MPSTPKPRFFCYERNFAMRWIPILYTSKPRATTKHESDRSPIYEITDSRATIKECEALFPAPAATKEIDSNG